jgi:hypothetical protein
LADGPVKAAELLTRATKEGHTERTLRRAKKDLDLASEKTPEGWLWKMPEGDDAE